MEVVYVAMEESLWSRIWHNAKPAVVLTEHPIGLFPFCSISPGNTGELGVD